MTLNFWRMCTANLLLFISVYMLFPLLPFVMGEQLGVSVGQAGSMFLVFVVAMFAVGPFHAYLVDAYKRKYVCMFAAVLMVVATIGYAFVTNLTELILLGTVQGLAFGIGTTAGITLAIDITNSTLRSAGKRQFLLDGTYGNDRRHYPRSMALSKPILPNPAHCICHNRSCRNPHVIRSLRTFPCADCHQTLFLRPLPIASWMGSCHQSDPDNLHSGTAGSHGTPFPKRFRTPETQESPYRSL